HAPAETATRDRERQQGPAVRARSPHLTPFRRAESRGPRISAHRSARGGDGEDPRGPRSAVRGPRETTMSSSRRVLQLFAFLAAWALVIIARLVQIQIVR